MYLSPRTMVGMHVPTMVGMHVPTMVGMHVPTMVGLPLLHRGGVYLSCTVVGVLFSHF